MEPNNISPTGFTLESELEWSGSIVIVGAVIVTKEEKEGALKRDPTASKPSLTLKD